MIDQNELRRSASGAFTANKKSAKEKELRRGLNVNLNKNLKRFKDGIDEGKCFLEHQQTGDTHATEHHSLLASGLTCPSINY